MKSLSIAVVYCYMPMANAFRQFAEKLQLVQLGFYRPLAGPDSMIVSVHIVDLVKMH